MLVRIVGNWSVIESCVYSFLAKTTVCTTVKHDEICCETREGVDHAMLGSNMWRKSSDAAKMPMENHRPPSCLALKLSDAWNLSSFGFKATACATMKHYGICREMYALFLDSAGFVAQVV